MAHDAAAGGPHVLAIDLGTSATKVALVDELGTVTAWAERPNQISLVEGGGVEQDPEEWWRGIVDASQELTARAPAAMRAVTAIGCSSQGEGTIAMGADGIPLMPCISWMDMRGAPHLRREFGSRVPRAGIDGLSPLKVAQWIRRTGGMPSTTGKDPAAHMLWVRDERPEIYARTEVFLNVLDYITLRLTGRPVATVDSILTSWVTDNRDPARIRYDDALVAGCGIDRDKLPEIVACTDIVGRLDRHVADLIGVPVGTPVVGGAIDTTAAAVGSGAIALGAVHLYLGTSSWLAAHVPRKQTDLRAGIASVPCALPDRYLLTALQATAGGNLTWLRDQVLYAADALSVGPAPIDAFQRLDEVVQGSSPGSGRVLYLPWIHGERAPLEDPHLRAGFLGMGLDTTRADLVRAVLEGVALNTRLLLGPMQRGTGAPVERITLVGGGARSAVWPQIMADVLGVQVHVPHDPVAANVRGAALIARVGTGALTWAEAERITRPGATLDPTPGSRALHDERFAAYRRAHRALAPFYRRVAQG